MDKFCANCGNKMAENEVFCGNCGTKAEAAPVAEAVVAETVVEAPVAEVPAVEQYVVEEAAPNKAPAFDINGIVDKVMAFVGDFIEKAKAKPVLFAIPAGIVVGVIAIILVFSLIFGGAGGGQKKAIANFIDVSVKGNISKIESLAPPQYWDYIEEENDMDLDDVKDEAEESWEYMEEMYEEMYGENVKISWKIVDQKKLSDKKLDKIADGLKENYDIPKKSVKAAYEMEVELKIKGSEDEDEDETSLYVAKIDGKWYPVSSDGSLLIG